nr:hypothetical protein BaRGS_019800 [Batillaria attramentaria]
MIESFTTGCQVELAKDPDSYVTDPETGKSIMNPEISTDICSTICDVHEGRSVTRFVVTVTVDGTVYSNELNVTVYDATCQNCTLEGCVKLPDTCLIDDQCYRDRDFNLDNVTQVSPLCDIAAGPCQKIVIDAAYIRRKDTLACKVRQVLPDTCLVDDQCYRDRDFNPDNVTQVSPLCDIAAGPCQKIVIDAAYIRRKDTLACKVRQVLPDTCLIDDQCYRDRDFNPDKVTHVSPLCDTAAGPCQKIFIDAAYIEMKDTLACKVREVLPSTCLIDDQCYRDRDFNPDNVTEVCDVAASASRWTYQAPGSDVSVSLTGPNADNAMECSFRPTETNPLFRYKVFWFIGWNDNRYSWTDELLPSGKTKAFYDVAKLPKTGTWFGQD